MKERDGYCAQKSYALAFYRLVVSCYFTVFAVIPLSHIHIEDETIQALSSLRESNSRNENLLLILHEVLFLHFKDRENHTLSSRSIMPESREVSNPLDVCVGTGSSHCYPSDGSIRHLPEHYKTAAVEGFCLFTSGLSPPSA